MRKFVFLFSIITLSLRGYAPAEEKAVLRLTMNDCLQMALNNNSEIKIKRIAPKIAKCTVRLKEGVYEPTFNAELKFKDSELPSSRPTFTGVPTDTEEKGEWNFGLSGLLPFGTTYDFDFLNSMTKGNSKWQVFYPEYSTSATITLTQPLLKGFFIDSNRANIRIARNDKKISEQDFIKEVINIVTNVKNAYYDFIYSQQSYIVGKTSLKRAKELHKIVKERYKKGMTSSVDLLESETGLTERKEALLDLEGKLKTSEDTLKLVTNIVDKPEYWDAEIAAVEKPQFRIERVDLASSIKEAFDNRTDYKRSKIDLKNKDVKIKLSWGNLMPQVDLKTSYALNGLKAEYEKAFEQAYGEDADHDDWYVALEITVPLGFEEEMADLASNKLEKQKALLSFYRLEQNIIFEVRDTLRSSRINHAKAKAARRRELLEEKRYNAAKERFSLGILSTRDMLEFQEDFEKAETNYLKAVIDYNKSLNELEKRKGTTLIENDIQLEET